MSTVSKYISDIDIIARFRVRQLYALLHLLIIEKTLEK